MSDTEEKVIQKSSELGESFSDLMKKVVEKELGEEKADSDTVIEDEADVIADPEETISEDDSINENLQSFDTIMKSAETNTVKMVEDPVFEWKQEPKPVVENYQPVSEVGVISAKTSINGTVSTKGHIRVEGSIIGDVFAFGDVKVKGKVAGDIEGTNIDLDECIVEGDIKARGDVNVCKGSTLSGNLGGQLVTIDGKIKGDVEAAKGAHMSASSLIKGSITAPTLSMSAGAELQGRVNVSKDDIE